MTPLLVAAALIAELFLVAGQVAITRSMLMLNRKRVQRGRFAGAFALGIAAMTVYFFLWLGLMQSKMTLSQQYPFEAVSPVLLVLAATIFLRERLSLRAWAGIVLISTGLAFISLSPGLAAIPQP